MNEHLNVTQMRKIWGYEKRPDGTLVITSYKGEETQLHIPAKIGKYPVTAIGESAFSLHRSGRRWPQYGALYGIRSVIIPEGVTAIEDGAFCDCENIAQIKLPDSLTQIGERAFAFCKSLVEIAVPENVVSVGREAFCGCDELRRVTLPEHMESPVVDVCFLGSAPKTYEIFARCNKLEVLQAPGIWPEKVKNPVVLRALLMSFLENPEIYKSPLKIKMYQDQMNGKQGKKLLQSIFAEDSVRCLATYCAIGKIPQENVEKEFLQPVLEAGAIQRVAFLLDWKNKQTSVETDML